LANWLQNLRVCKGAPEFGQGRARKVQRLVVAQAGHKSSAWQQGTNTMARAFLQAEVDHIIKQRLDDVKQVIDLLELAPRVLVELPLEREQVQIL